MKEFINKYFKDEENFYISFINHTDNRDIQNFLHNKTSFNKFYEKFLYKNKKQSMYFTFNSFKEDSKQKIKTNVNSLKSIIFDFDDVEHSEEDLKKLINVFPNYFYILNTSPKKYQICYKFDTPSKFDFDEFEKILYTLSNHFKSDKNICSIEKLSRFPKSFNRKNDFETKLFYNQSNENTTELKQFIDFINENNIEIIEKPSKHKHLQEKNIKTVKNSVKTLNKIDLIDDLTISDDLIKKYNSIYRRNKDASIVDILYIRERKKKTNDFNLIFSEILKIREVLNLPLKRTIESYYNERYNNIFLK